jgi:hypothetical protein
MFGGGFQATNKGAREISLGSTLRREGPLGTDCGAKRGQLLAPQSVPSAQSAPQGIFADTLVGGLEAHNKSNNVCALEERQMNHSWSRTAARHVSLEHWIHTNLQSKKSRIGDRGVL